jgi:small-conductance mechanosensitive channel
MGRKKKYHTPEEKLEAQRKWVREYYKRNKERLNKNSMEKYYELRKNLQSDNRKSKESS